MAKIIEHNLVVKFSKIVRYDSDSKEKLLDDDTLANLEQVIQEIVGPSVVVELIEE